MMKWILVAVIIASLLTFALIVFVINKKKENEKDFFSSLKKENYEKRIKIEIKEKITLFIEEQLDIVRKFDSLDENINAGNIKKNAQIYLNNFTEQNVYKQYMLVEKDRKFDNLIKKLKETSVMVWEKKCMDDIKEVIYGR